MVSMCRIINNNKKREVRHATDCCHVDQKMMRGPRVYTEAGVKQMIVIGRRKKVASPHADGGGGGIVYWMNTSTGR
jgi:hypothetical protein